MSMDRLVQRVRRSGSLRRKPSPILSDATRSGVIDGDFICDRFHAIAGAECEVCDAKSEMLREAARWWREQEQCDAKPEGLEE